MNRMNKVPVFFTLLLPALLAGCAASRQPVQKNAVVLPASGTRQTVLTLVLQANWGPDSSVLFSIYNDIRNEGRVGQKTQKKSTNTGFIVYFAGKSGMKRDSLFIDHPLKERVETGTGKGISAEEQFIKEESYTEISVNYNPEMKRLILADLQTGKQQTLEIR